MAGKRRPIGRCLVYQLEGRVAIVTGGNGGIGLGMARGLWRGWAWVVLAAGKVAKSEARWKELEAFGAEARAVPTDVTDEAAVGRMIRATLDAFGRLDVLVNNAGTNIRKPPHEVSLAEWRQVLDTNLTSAYLCSHAAYPTMKAGGRGKIINIGSMMSIFGAGFAPAYAASKGGIVQFTRACASAWAQDNIQVNAVLPGWIDTALTRRARQEIPGLHVDDHRVAHGQGGAPGLSRAARSCEPGRRAARDARGQRLAPRQHHERGESRHDPGLREGGEFARGPRLGGLAPDLHLRRADGEPRHPAAQVVPAVAALAPSAGEALLRGL